MSCTVRLSYAPPHPVLLYVQPKAGKGVSDPEKAVFAYHGSMLLLNGWTHPQGGDWSELNRNWSRGARASLTAPVDSDVVVVANHFVIPVPYDFYRPCTQGIKLIGTSADRLGTMPGPSLPIGSSPEPV